MVVCALLAHVHWQDFFVVQQYMSGLGRLESIQESFFLPPPSFSFFVLLLYIPLMDSPMYAPSFTFAMLLHLTFYTQGNFLYSGSKDP